MVSKNLSSRSSQAFTLVELIIVIAIVALVSVVGGLNIASRMQIARLENAASQIVSDMNYARSAAMLKGCPTRIIFCTAKDCAGAPQTLTANTEGLIELTGEIARYYGILRMFQDTDETDICWDDDSVGPVNAIDIAVDGFTWWDHDRRPQSIPPGLGFKAIYFGSPNNIVSLADESSSNAALVASGFMFQEEGGDYVGVSTMGTTSSGAQILFQVQEDDCVAATDDDCVAYFITFEPGGIFDSMRCTKGGARAQDITESDNCF